VFLRDEQCNLASRSKLAFPFMIVFLHCVSGFGFLPNVLRNSSAEECVDLGEFGGALREVMM